MQYSSLFRLFLPLFILSAFAFGQSTSLTLSSTSVQPGGSASLNLALANTATGGKPASVEFTLGYSSSDFSAVSVSAGAVATGAGKSITCVPVTGGQTCILFGINNTGMGDGALANLTATLGSSSNTTRSIQVTAPVAASALGSNLTIGATGGTVTVTTPVSISLSGVSCGPVSLASGTSSSCTVSLSGAATSSTVVALSSSNASLIVPASVTVSAGQSTATFSATAGTISVDGSAIITATSNGVSKTASISLTSPAAVLSSVACAPSTVNSGSSSICTVSLSKATTAAKAITLASGHASLTVPASATVAAGQMTAQFSASAASVTTNTSAMVTASSSGTNKTTMVTIQASTQSQLTSVSCDVTSLQGPSLTTCAVKLSANAPAAGTIVYLVDNSSVVGVPSKVTVPAGSSTASFIAIAQKVAQIQPVVITATAGSASVNTTLTVLPPTTLRSLSCTPSTLAVGASANCTVLVSTNVPRNTSVALASSNAAVRTANSATIHAGQASVTFTATASAASSIPATITATVYGTSATATIRVGGNTTSSLRVIGEPSSVNGEAVNLQLEATDAKDNSSTLSALDLPAGARFDASNGSFSWEPAGVANGSYAVKFAARNSSGTVENLEVMVDVASGAPVVKKMVHAVTRKSEGACSAGSIAILEGMGLSHGDEDVQVLVNGNPVRVLKSNSKQIAIQCPELRGGTALTVQTKRGAFWSNTLETVNVEAAPGILSLDRAGDEVEIRATGLGSEASLSLDKVQMMMGDRAVPVTGVKMDEQGIFHLTVQLPEVNQGGEASMRLALRLNDGHVVESNAVKILIEGRDGSDAVR